MYVVQTRVLFLGLSGSSGPDSSIYYKSLPAVLERISQLVCSRGLHNNVNSVPKLAEFVVSLFRFGLAWHTIGIYHSAISAFIEPQPHHKVSNHPIISKLMHYFYLQLPPSYKQFNPWGVECLLVLLESWAPACSLITNLLGRHLPF